MTPLVTANFSCLPDGNFPYVRCRGSRLLIGRKGKMKAHSRTKGRPLLPRRLKEVSVADQILGRIKTITGELEALQAEIYQQVSQGSRQSRPDSGDNSRARLLGEFKVTLDRLRHTLWFYLEQVTSQPASLKQQPQEPAPLRRDLYSRSTPMDAPRTPSGSFFDRLDVVIDNYMKNTSTRGETNPRKRAKT